MGERVSRFDPKLPFAASETSAAGDTTTTLRAAWGGSGCGARARDCTAHIGNGRTAPAMPRSRCADFITSLRQFSKMLILTDQPRKTNSIKIGNFLPFSRPWRRCEVPGAGWRFLPAG